MEEINNDRKQIIQIIELLYKDIRFNSIRKILQRLNYSNLPISPDKIENSKMVIHRLIDFKNNDSLGDKIRSIKYSDLLKQFEERFKDYNIKKSFSAEIISKEHDHYYIYYYESFSETTKEYLIKLAVIGFNSEINKNEWKDGKIYYLDDYNDINKIFELKRIEPPKPNADVLFFSATLDNQINFFTLKIMGKRIDFRGIIPLTYSVLETAYKIPCAGTAILEKTNYAECIKKIDGLQQRNAINKHPGVSDIITNALYHHKYILNDEVFDKANELSTEQGRVLGKVKGIWSGVHLRTDFDDSYGVDDKGGICKFVLKINGSGECELFWGKDEDTSFQGKAGFVEFPFADSSLMKIYLEFLKKEKTYKLILFLSAAPLEKNKFVYKGVISGWMSIERKIYTSPVYMIRIHKMSNEGDSLNMNEILNRENPKRISKTQKEEIERIDASYLKALKKAQEQFMAKFSNCMPEYDIGKG